MRNCGNYTKFTEDLQLKFPLVTKESYLFLATLRNIFKSLSLDHSALFSFMQWDNLSTTWKIFFVFLWKILFDKILRLTLCNSKFNIRSVMSFFFSSTTISANMSFHFNPHQDDLIILEPGNYIFVRNMLFSFSCKIETKWYYVAGRKLQNMTICKIF